MPDGYRKGCGRSMSLKIAILASGRGSNAKAILDAIEVGALDATVQCLISNVDEAPVLEIGKNAGLQTLVIPHKGLSRETHEAKLLAHLANFEIDYLVLAGYMRIMTPGFIKQFQGENHYRIINIHPSLLPAFLGTSGYEDAYHYGVKLSGVTVHFVDEGTDTGPILMQATFPRHDKDSLADFKARGLAVEHELYPKALQCLAENRVFFRYDSESSRTYVEVKTHAPC